MCTHMASTILHTHTATHTHMCKQVHAYAYLHGNVIVFMSANLIATATASK